MSSVSHCISHCTGVHTRITRPQNIDGDTTGGVAGGKTAGAGRGPVVGEWEDCIRWCYTGEGDRAGWSVVGRTWQREIRRWAVVHLDTHIQS